MSALERPLSERRPQVLPWWSMCCQKMNYLLSFSRWHWIMTYRPKHFTDIKYTTEKRIAILNSCGQRVPLTYSHVGTITNVSTQHISVIFDVQSRLSFSLSSGPFSLSRSISKKNLSSSIFLVGWQNLAHQGQVLREKKICGCGIYRCKLHSSGVVLRAPLSLEQMGVNYIRHAKLYTALLNWLRLYLLVRTHYYAGYTH